MFAEFFVRSKADTLVVAWGGLLVVLGYALFLAWVKARINDFYSRFYDLMQLAGGLEEDGSGEFASGPSLQRVELQQRVTEELWTFALIVAPLVFASPAAKWVRSAWAFAWRASLMKAYLGAWDTSKEPIEGASQRLHEDTQRFATALQSCLATVLDALFTLAVFSPILVRLSGEIAPPLPVGVLRGCWLWLLAFGAATVGLGGAAFAGRHLVFLEVANQRVEASLRKDLVLLETTPAMIVGTSDRLVGSVGGDTIVAPVIYAPLLYFGLTLKRLSSNYHALFRHFTLLNTWLSFYDQVMVIVPYVVAAPLLFATDPARRITLGTLVQMSNSFDKTFSSLSVVAESWAAVNEFRSVVLRLGEFERKLYARQAESARTRASTHEHGPGHRRGDGGGGGGGDCCLLPAAALASDAEPHEPQQPHEPHQRPPEPHASQPGPGEVVVVEGGPIQLSTTYGRAFEDYDSYEGYGNIELPPRLPRARDDMRV